jgi:hypothetical protein
LQDGINVIDSIPSYDLLRLLDADGKRNPIEIQLKAKQLSSLIAPRGRETDLLRSGLGRALAALWRKYAEAKPTAYACEINPEGIGGSFGKFVTIMARLFPEDFPQGSKLRRFAIEAAKL